MEVSREEKMISLVVGLLLVAQFSLFGWEYQSRSSEAREASTMVSSEFSWCSLSQQALICFGEQDLKESDQRLLRQRD